MLFQSILESKEVIQYLEKRGLLQQYKKAKTYISLGLLSQVNFQLRQPKEKEIYYFRINKQFRALCIIKNTELRIFEISNHQEK